MLNINQTGSESRTQPDIHLPTDPRIAPHVLVVNDDTEFRDLLTEVLIGEGYEVAEAPSGAEALLALYQVPFDAVILDKNMGGLSGMDILPGLRTAYPETPVVFITAFGDEHTGAAALEKGAFAFLRKPFRMEELLESLQRALYGWVPSAHRNPGIVHDYRQ